MTKVKTNQHQIIYENNINNKIKFIYLRKYIFLHKLKFFFFLSLFHNF